MVTSMELLPGVTLRCIHDGRFKQGVLTLRLLRPMCLQEASMNYILPQILLRGCRQAPTMQQVVDRLDELYGTGMGANVQRLGDWQSTGLAMRFLDDRFALPGEQVLAPAMEFLFQLLLEPLQEDGGFCREYFQGEKENLLSEIQSQIADKRSYASAQLLKLMCRGDSQGVPRMGTLETAQALTPQALWQHYEKILRESHMEIFYVGSQEPEQVASLAKSMLSGLTRDVRPLDAHKPFVPQEGVHERERLEIAQSRLCMGFISDITCWDSRYPALRVLERIYGGGMTSKLFMNVREKQGLCYEIGAATQGPKGLMVVNTGIDASQEEAARASILRELDNCRQGRIRPQELEAAKLSLKGALTCLYDSPGAMEDYFSTDAILGQNRSPQAYALAVDRVSLEDVAAAARSLSYHSSFFLEGGSHE